MLKSTERFSSRVDNYVKYRPDYPGAVIDLLRSKCGLDANSRVADVGSGTGILTSRLLETGAEVFAVEPNSGMRAAAEQLLGSHPRFRSVAGTAEATTLPDHSINLVTAGQAFHWFDVQKTRREWTRVLVPSGWVALVWNERPRDATPFMDDYEALLRRHAAEYDKVTSSRVDVSRISEFFAGAFEIVTFHNQQVFDYDGLEGRLMSSSYAPEPGHPEHEPMIAGLREVFARHQRDGQIVFPYETLVYLGRSPQAG
jgi:ubiquinone/menaquinone biosynthesis C-methylase UbiE